MSRHTLMRAVLCMVLILIAESCSDTQRHCEYVPLMPLSVGNKWVYVDCTAASGGGEPECWGQDTLRITGVRTLAGKGYFVTDRALALRQTSEGLSLVGYRGNQFEYIDYFLRYPIADGTMYDYWSSRVDQPGMLVRMDSEVVEVPAGTYCTFTYRIYFGSGPAFVTFSFAPGVGIVKEKYANGYLAMLMSTDLVEHQPGCSLEPAAGICAP